MSKELLYHYNDMIDQLQQENEQLKQQLEEKDKEIDELKFIQRNSRGLIEKVSEQAQKNLRYEICEEIRAYFEVNPNVVEWDYLNEILNQIEGETDEK